MGNMRSGNVNTKGKLDAAQDGVLERLRCERQDLVSSGLYNHKDSIIEELDRSIQSRLLELSGNT
jgi:hypothetical protein